MKIQWNKLLLSLLPLFTGILSSLLTGDSFSYYEQLKKPLFAPPSFVFPIVWTLLYLLLGISFYLIQITPSPFTSTATLLYLLQLVLNFLWSPVFFSLQNTLLAFFILLLLWIVVFQMIRAFYRISPLSAWLQVPYLLWLTFAGYLNLSVLLLNQ
ncbi:MAG: tryptophan-rich sensory protein [Clostridiales bacterium]|nr:tryptophan-rich sensory protein [Clostridiales bacterium]